jgi:hypothetical protein
MAESQKILAEMVFPKDREDYIYKNVSALLLAFIILYAIYKNIDHDLVAKILFIFFLFVVVIVTYKKFYMFFTVDRVLLSPRNIIILHKNKYRKTYLENIGIKIAYDTKNNKEISIFDIDKNKEIFYCKENDVDKDELQKFFAELLQITNIDKSVFEYGTYGEIISLRSNDFIDSDINYLQKKYFFDYLGYRWMIYPFFVLIVVIILYMIKK